MTLQALNLIKPSPVVLVGLQESAHSIDVDVYHLERSNGGCGLTHIPDFDGHSV